MNNGYSVIWNTSLGAWVAILEVAKGNSFTSNKLTTDEIKVGEVAINNTGIHVGDKKLQVLLLMSM